MRLDVIGAPPSPDEVAAIVAALSLAEPASEAAAAEPVSGWKLAMRHPGLSLDDVRALRRSRPPNV